MLVHDPDSARQLARYKEFLPPRGKVTVSERIDDDFAERDEQGNKIDSSPPDESFTKKSVGGFNLDQDFGEKAPSCGGGSCKAQTSDGWYAVHFETGKDGKLYLSGIERYRWRGCPC
jgi:hypothetical protein